MTGRSPAARDERPHPLEGRGAWEVWSFDLIDAGRALGFHLALELADGRAVVRGALLGEGRPLVSLVVEDLPAPRVGLEVRGPGIWAAPECETPLEHWSMGLEAFALTLDDPWDALGVARGDRTPVGADLEWEAAAAPVPLTGAGAGYEVPALAHGELLVGAERLLVDGAGTWAHRWGGASGVGWSRYRAAGLASRPASTQGRPIRVADLRGGLPDVTVEGRTLGGPVVGVAPAPTARGPVVRALLRPDGPAGSWGWLLVGDDSLASS